MTIFVNIFLKCQVFGNFLTFKWQFSGGSGSYLTRSSISQVIADNPCFYIHFKLNLVTDWKNASGDVGQLYANGCVALNALNAEKVQKLTYSRLFVTITPFYNLISYLRNLPILCNCHENVQILQYVYCAHLYPIILAYFPFAYFHQLRPLRSL